MSSEPETRQERRRRLLRALRLPMVSGRISAAILFALFVGSTLIIVPLARRWPPWIEAEIVLVVWWLVWVGALTYLLFTGRNVAHDHRLAEPRKWLNMQDGPRGCWSVLDIFSVGDLGVDGCAGAFMIILLLIVAIPLLILLAWFVIEVAIPAIAFITYLLIRGMLAHVANDKHDCKASMPRSLFWGVAWASVYIAPQALVVWTIHLVAARAHAG